MLRVYRVKVAENVYQYTCSVMCDMYWKACVMFIVYADACLRIEPDELQQ